MGIVCGCQGPVFIWVSHGPQKDVPVAASSQTDNQTEHLASVLVLFFGGEGANWL